MSSTKWFIGLPQREDGKYELTRDEICNLLDDYEAYFKQNSHKHGVMQAEGSEGADGAAVASEGQEKSVSAEVHDCTKYAKINCKCEGYCEYEERLAGRLPRQQLF